MNQFTIQMIWIAAAAIGGWAVTAIGAGRYELPRNTFLLIYLPLAGAFLAAYAASSSIDVAALITDNWGWGLIGAGIASAIALLNVLKQPSSPRRTGGGFAVDLLWPGVTYGLIDALLLSVLPVVAVGVAFEDAGLANTAAGTIAEAAVALTASLVVTATYHLGYPEFRNRSVWWTLVGNGLFTVAMLVTGNALAAVVPHIVMHVASMVHGRETTLQLPPHYDQRKQAA